MTVRRMGGPSGLNLSAEDTRISRTVNGGQTDL
jgi:hypothetical protein